MELGLDFEDGLHDVERCLTVLLDTLSDPSASATRLRSTWSACAIAMQKVDEVQRLHRSGSPDEQLAIQRRVARLHQILAMTKQAAASEQGRIESVLARTRAALAEVRQHGSVDPGGDALDMHG